MTKIRGVLIRPHWVAEEYAFDYNNYMDLYPVLDCDTFDCVQRKFGKNYYDIYLDDEGLLTDKEPAIYTRDDSGRNIIEVLVGNCFICKHDHKGDIISLTDNEVKEILNNNIMGVAFCDL